MMYACMYGWAGALLYTGYPRIDALEHCYLQYLHTFVCASTATYRHLAYFFVQVLQIAVLQRLGILGDTCGGLEPCYTGSPRLVTLEHCYLQYLHTFVCASTATYTHSAYFRVQVVQIAVLQRLGILADI